MSNPEPIQSNAGYEEKDANVRAILVTAIVSVVVIALIVVALYRYFISTREEVYQQQVLQTVSRDLLELTRLEDSVLSSYELLDSINGTYRVPIERAMELLVEESPGTSSPQ